ncbi:uncharacterized protein BDR25DRAFT_5584 [Lindgomyces ingoldianus]|uniref:Uncharacterized protein n=1 Tax=Lindgomyces ingoldianus TaxID=673940 RepID=A0ACB6RFN0_9PLEO|nr:uncharacterized protein BDR25DRAFT_5584 [Lindgomyces ingoldianus]KAF2477926.1 hypothetical protein BDR25DRAFT_5584 [Lindgomyces ingoldianus]
MPLFSFPLSLAVTVSVFCVCNQRLAGCIHRHAKHPIYIFFFQSKLFTSDFKISPTRTASSFYRIPFHVLSLLGLSSPLPSPPLTHPHPPTRTKRRKGKFESNRCMHTIASIVCLSVCRYPIRAFFLSGNEGMGCCM